MTFLSAFVRLSSSAWVARSVRPSYSSTTVPYVWMPVLLGLDRVLHGVDVVDRHFGRRVPVFGELILQRLQVARAAFVERLHRQRLLEVGEDLLRLVGQRELVGGGQIPALVLARGNPVQHHEDGEEQHGAAHRDRPVPDVAPPKRSGDVAPLAEHVERGHDEAGEREALIPLAQLGLREAQHHGRQDQHETEPPEQSNEALHG